MFYYVKLVSEVVEVCHVRLCQEGDVVRHFLGTQMLLLLLQVLFHFGLISTVVPKISDGTKGSSSRSQLPALTVELPSVWSPLRGCTGVFELLLFFLLERD